MLASVGSVWQGWGMPLPLPLTPRRHFLRQCAAGLTLATVPGAGLFAQMTGAGLVFTGLRWKAGSVALGPTQVMTLTLRHNGTARWTRTITGSAGTSTYAIAEEAVDFAAAAGSWSVYCRVATMVDGAVASEGTTTDNLRLGNATNRITVRDSGGAVLASFSLVVGAVRANPGQAPEYHALQVQAGA